MLNNFFPLYWSQYILLGICVLVAAGFFSLLERNLLGLIHFRIGPNNVSLKGLFQVVADAINLLTKDDRPVHWSNYILFYASPLLLLALSLSVWVLFPFKQGTSMALSVISLIIFLGMGVYGLLLSGWSSNSNYALIGSIRCVAQSLSYEVVLSFIFISVILCYNTYSFGNFWEAPLTSLALMGPGLLVLFTLAILAEINRTPFDLAEGESELVSGYSVEYGGVMYTILFLAETISVFLAAFLITFFFFFKHSVLLPLMWAVSSVAIGVVRGALPRIRYDVLIIVCWIVLLPLALLVLSQVALIQALVCSLQ